MPDNKTLRERFKEEVPSESCSCDETTCTKRLYDTEDLLSFFEAESERMMREERESILNRVEDIMSGWAPDEKNTAFMGVMAGLEVLRRSLSNDKGNE